MMYLFNQILAIVFTALVGLGLLQSFVYRSIRRQKENDWKDRSRACWWGGMTGCVVGTFIAGVYWMNSQSKAILPDDDVFRANFYFWTAAIAFCGVVIVPGQTWEYIREWWKLRHPDPPAPPPQHGDPPTHGVTTPSI